MTHNPWIYIFIMAAVSYAIRCLPMTLIRKPIKSRFIQSFLYYVPYVTLAVMTFPAIVEATQSPISGAAALVGLVWRKPDCRGGGLLRYGAAAGAVSHLNQLSILPRIAPGQFFRFSAISY